MDDRQRKYETFRALHHGDAAFVMPNPWDIGSARLLTALGFSALGTTSLGYALSHGRRDSAGSVSRADMLANARDIAAATDLPVSADLADGFGAEPEECARTVVQAADAGLVGGSIEDATGDPDAPIHDFTLAVERVQAAAEAVRGLPFLLTARSENFLCGRNDLDDTIARLQAFARAGADVLYAPGLPDLDAIRAVCSAVDRPVNVVAGLQGPYYSVDELSSAGVRRISVGGSFARAAFGGLLRAAEEVRTQGTFCYAAELVPGALIAEMVAAG